MRPLYFPLLLITLLLLAAGSHFASDDLFGKLAIPTIFYQSGCFPYVDHFSFTAAGHSWIDHEWLSGFVYYHLLEAFGDWGLTGLKALLLSLCIYGPFALARRYQIHPSIPFYLLLLGYQTLLNGFAANRPQMFTFTFTSLSLWILFSLKESKNTLQIRLFLLITVLLALLWSNLHGGFVVGLGLFGLFSFLELLAQKKPGKFTLATGIFFATSFINPYGTEYWHYILYAISLPRTVISEWQGTPLLNMSYLPFKLLCLLPLIAFLYWLSTRHTQAQKNESLLLILFSFGAALLGLRVIKHQPLATIIICSLLPVALRHELQRLFQWLMERKTLIQHTVLLILPLVAVYLMTLPAQHSPAGSPPPYWVSLKTERAHPNENQHGRAYPVGAMRYLQASKLSGNLLTPFESGQFAFWNLYPQFKIGLDGRYEAIYDEATVRKILAVYQGDLKALSGLHSQFILLDRSQFNLLPNFLNTHQWTLLYGDLAFIVLAQTALLPTSGEALLQEEAKETPSTYLPLTLFFKENQNTHRFASYCKEAHRK